ncbi:hypothetical protein QBC42DRAFT_257009 [Cladorrhinum samala]|uniref:Uncharacterized protein n=1 Tax=Cladorrhinum samala TaxID=585594 RepID=A0AAV9HB44_9PEZI|nr:hypothetical protein QBC42DRAFT_257009 [Cladorrhinum samala]
MAASTDTSDKRGTVSRYIATTYTGGQTGTRTAESPAPSHPAAKAKQPRGLENPEGKIRGNGSRKGKDSKGKGEGKANVVFKSHRSKGGNRAGEKKRFTAQQVQAWK